MGAKEMPKTKVGDRVRVTYGVDIEGEVVDRSASYLTVEYKNTPRAIRRRTFYRAELPDNFKVEVLEPAEVEFQPGDIVESKYTGVRFQILPDRRVLCTGGVTKSTVRLTSKDYTKVGHINELLKS